MISDTVALGEQVIELQKQLKSLEITFYAQWQNFNFLPPSPANKEAQTWWINARATCGKAQELLGLLNELAGVGNLTRHAAIQAHLNKKMEKQNDN